MKLDRTQREKIIFFLQSQLTVEEAKSKASLNDGRMKALGGGLGQVHFEAGLGLAWLAMTAFAELQVTHELSWPRGKPDRLDRWKKKLIAFLPWAETYKKNNP